MVCWIKIPRCLQLREEVESISVHAFVDASEMAYGAAFCVFEIGGCWYIL